jgi:hypothetical protein
MTCAEFQAVLPDLLEGSGNADQRAHLTLCPACSELLSDINAISQEARFLRASDDPSPRVWASIELALRQEGLIREPGLQLVPPSTNSLRRWTVAWLLPATAAFLVTFGVLRYERPATPPQSAAQSAAVPAGPAVATASQPASIPADANEDDKQLLEEVSSRSPTMRASYEKELRHVNEYIRDAEKSAKAHPEDEEAQQYLMNAYEQKAMVYELAVDRSLP